jgi:hypothetical protein
MTDPTFHKPARRRVRRLIRAFKRTFPNAPPTLGKKIIRSSYTRGGIARRCTNRSDQTIAWLTTLAWLRHHRTDYDRQVAQTNNSNQHAALRRAANRQARQIMKRWQ